jgi:hypothetical protein
MKSENILKYYKLSYNLFAYEKRCNLTIEFNNRDGLIPFSKIIHCHNNVMIPLSQGWVVVREIHPPLSEGTNGNY